MSIDSTLGYEALARGSKVVMFAGIRGDSYPLNTRRFGWPADIPETGRFWTNSHDSHIWERVMDYVISIKNNDWREYSENYIKSVISFDQNNSNFVALMKEINAPLCSKYKNPKEMA